MKVEDLEKNYEKNSRFILIVFVIGCIFSLIAPTIFTSIALHERWNFTQTGPIGDTIGGIMSPFLNLIGGVLLFYSFREQYKANIFQQIALQEEINQNRISQKHERIDKLIDQLIYDIDNLSYYTREQANQGFVSVRASEIRFEMVEHKGLKALVTFNKGTYFTNDESNISFLKNLNYIIYNFENTLSEIIRLKSNKWDRRFYTDKLARLYFWKLEEEFVKITKRKYSERDAFSETLNFTKNGIKKIIEFENFDGAYEWQAAISSYKISLE